MKIWKYNARVGRWDFYGGPYTDRSYAEAMLARLERDEPGSHQLADKRPISAAEGELRKQSRERKAKRKKITVIGKRVV